MKIGERIRQKRLELGLSQDELARKCGYKSRSSINKIEIARDMPLNKIELVAKALGCSPAYLMGWEEEAEPTKENAVTLASIMKDKALLNYIKKIMSLPAKKKEALYKYIDFLSSSDD